MTRKILLIFLAFSNTVAAGVAYSEVTYDVPFVAGSSYNENVPAPAKILGYPVGTQPATYGQIAEYFKVLSESVEHVQLRVYGRTHEGRDLIYLIVSSPENMRDLDRVKENIGKLYDPRKIASEAEARAILESNPAVAWLGYSIHGDELSPADAAIWVAYQLAAGQDETSRKIRKQTVVCIDPMQNPDGRERFLAQMRMFRGKVPNPDVQSSQHRGMWPRGRGNHYLFDLNRDFFILSQPESRARVKVYQEWNPQLLVDSHEMGPMSTYLFSPAREPLNPNFTPTHHKWGHLFAKDQSEAFDRYGWSYYTREWHEAWYPGYNEWSAFRGAIQILYEQAKVDGSLVRKRDGTIVVYRETVHHNVVSSLANLRTLSERRSDVLADYYKEAQNCIAPLEDNEIHAYLIEPATNTTRELDLIENLLAQGIEVHRAERAFKAQSLQTTTGESIDERGLLAGTWIVPTNQPSKNLVNAILEFDPRMTDSYLREERFYLEKKNSSRMYDVSSWAMPLAYGVRCFQTTRPVDVSTTPVTEVRRQPGSAPNAEAKYGYILHGSQDVATRAVTQLMERGCNVRVCDEPFKAGKSEFPKGSFLLRRTENPKDLLKTLQEISRDTGAALRAADTALDLDGVDLGGGHFSLLTQPRIGLLFSQVTSTYSFGAAWNLLDNLYRTRLTSINVVGGIGDLRSYNVLVVPSVWNMKSFRRMLPDGAMDTLRHWIRDGGTLIALGSSVQLFTDEDAKMSAVRARTDVLDELDIYAQAVQREVDALTATANQADVWDYQPEDISSATKTESSEQKDKSDADALKRQDEWEKRFSPQGAFLRGNVDPHHWLTYGIGDPIPVLVGSSRSLYSKYPVETPVRLGSGEDIRISGLIWPEARNRLANTAYLTREKMGQGQIILFPFEPHLRGYYPETTRLLWNAVYLGPGLGASAPIEW